MIKSIIEFQETIEPFQQFHAVWPSPCGADEYLIIFHSEQQFKQNMIFLILQKLIILNI